jgi:branched-chain amino acid transport system permease protein
MSARWQAVVKTGLIAGIVAIYLAMVGMVEQFAEIYAIGTSVTLARLLFVIPPLGAGWLATRPRVERGERRVLSAPESLATGGLAGLVVGGLVAVAMLAVDAYGIDTVRQVFIAVSPKLFDILSFDHSVGTGALIWIIGAALMGAIGGGLRTTPTTERSAVIAGALTILTLALLQRVVSTSIKELGFDSSWLYDRSTGGLTWSGGIGAAVLAVAATIAWRLTRTQLPDRGETPASESLVIKPKWRPIGIGATFVVALAVPWVIGSALSGTVGTVLIFILLGLGLNIVVGYAGLLDLGYVAFFAFGAYSTALLTGASVNTTEGAANPSFGLHLNFYLAIPVVIVLAAMMGLLVGAPVLRLRGDYLAIVTLGLGEVVYTLVTSRWAQPLVGGPQGMRNITKAELLGSDFQNDPQQFYYLALAFVALAVFVSWRLEHSRVGRAWSAMREDEQVADAMGISTTRYKLLAFSTGGAIGALGGALFAVQIGSLTPKSFDVNVSILALAVVILGGLGSLRGVVAGSLALVGLPGFLREFEEFRPLALGVVIIAIMLLRPQGILPRVHKAADIEDEDRAQDSWTRAAGAGGLEAGGEPA